MSACTCHPCGRSFTGLTAFDKHQQVDYSRRPAVVCLDPATLGMVQNSGGRWGYPMTDERREQLAAMRGSDGTAPSGRLPENLSDELVLSPVSGRTS